MTALGLVWRFGDCFVGSGRFGGVEVQRVAVVQLVEALAMLEFPEGALRWAPALLGVRKYPVERLAEPRLEALEERSSRLLALASTGRLPPLFG